MNQLPLFDTTNDLPPPAKVKPIIKWAGGKSWLVSHLAPGIWCRLQRTRGRYIEPFLGGGALAFHLGLPDMALGDALVPLVDLYRALAQAPGAVAWALSALATEGVDKETYLRVRDARPTSLAQRAARFIYLNKLGYNGLYRENKSGKFNVPYGKASYRGSVVERKGRDSMGGLFPNKEMLRKVGEIVKAGQIFAGSFEAIIALAGKGDVIYADPPYDGTYAAYTALGFDDAAQARLADVLRDAYERGAAVIATNSDTARVRKLYDWATVTTTQEKRAINSNGRGRGGTPCVIATTDATMVGT